MVGSLLSLLVLTQSTLGHSSYVRTVQQAGGTEVAQTLVQKLVAPGKPDVYLVGVAHIGTKAYYTNLQALLDSKDVVLYEGVQRKGKPIQPSKPDPNLPKPVYEVLGDAVGLDFQLADVRYDRPHWINSDLSMDELQRLNKAGSGGKTTQFDTVEKMLDPKSPQTKMITEFFKSATPSMKEAIKIFLVEKLSHADELLAKQIDKTTYNVLLTSRNNSIFKVFNETIGASHPPKSVAIFYGAAHLVGVQSGLTHRYGYKVAGQVWYTFATADRRKLDASGRDFLNSLSSLAGKL